ncbi:MAG TPA: hypothetical protein VFT72_06770 [Opitutaceae bacterium]|nr:hypothetical protein [Opitutaceae bacterium]
MNTSAKILIAVAAVILAAHFCPVLLMPFSFIGVLLMILATVIGLLVGAGLLTCAIVITVLAALATALSPIWLPVLVIVGIVHLCRRPDRRIA